MTSPHLKSLRNRALQLLCQGRSVNEVARQLQLAPQTVSRWHDTRVSQSELTQAHTRIEKLENEVAACRHLIDLMKDVMPPKDATR